MKEEQKNNIFIYKTEDGQTDITVRLENEDVWLSQQQMAELYQTSRTNVVEHIKHIFEEGELAGEATCRKFRQVQKEGRRNVEREIHYAVNKQTAAETIYSRTDAEKDFMGLTTFAGEIPIKTERKIATNYLSEDELFRLNRMVSAFFDLAEIKAREHSQMRMKDWVAELDKFAAMYGKGVLPDAGKISHDEAMQKADQEYRQYQVKTLSPVEKAYLDSIKAVQKQVEKKTGDSKGERPFVPTRAKQ